MPQRPDPISLKKIYLSMDRGDEIEPSPRYEANPNLYVYSDYMRPSRRIERYQIKIHGKRGTLTHEYFIPAVRKEDLPKFTKKKWVKEGGEKFNKEGSVFK